MFSYTFRNLKTMFTKQRLLSLLLVLNIIVSCLVICFSSGVYRNFQYVVDEGVEEEITDLSVLINSENCKYVIDDKYLLCVDKKLTPQMFINFLTSLSEETQNNIASIGVSVLSKTPLSYFQGINVEENDWAEIETRDDIYYSDDCDQFYWPLNFEFKLKDGMLVDANDELYMTYEQYNSGDKIVAVPDSMFLDITPLHQPFGYAYGGIYGKGEYNDRIEFFHRIFPEGTEYLLFGGEKYKIVNVFEYENYDPIIMPIAAMPNDAVIPTYYTFNDNHTINYDVRMAGFGMSFNEPCTHRQYDEIQERITEIFGKEFYLEDIEFVDADEIYYLQTVMLISVIIAVLAAINMAILYRYILEKRSGDLAILRICGCTAQRAIAYYLIECMIINAPLFALSELCYHMLFRPRLTVIFSAFGEAYSFKLYAAIFCIYVAISVFIMYAMISKTVRKHSLVEMKGAPKATNKFGIMKVFEIAQLAVVLSIMVMITSTIVSRYEKFKPFEPYLSRQGYMIQGMGDNAYPEYLEGTVIGDTEHIINEYVNIFIDGDIMLNSILYSDEFIEAYSPSIADGVWLSGTDETYEKDGYIPAVITSCGGRYKVGDTITSDVIMASTDPDNSTIHAKYKIIGVLNDYTSIASYIVNNYNMPESYLDIYAVFSDSFEEEDWLLVRSSDSYACYGHHGPAYGTQFIFCDDMTDEEYRELGDEIEKVWERQPYAPLSTVYKNSKSRIYEQMYTLFPIAVCIFILTIISTVSISAIYTKRQLRNYAIFYICGARWRTCALKSLKNGAITCAVSAILSALILIIGKTTLLKETVISFGVWHLAVCAGVIVLYLALSMIMPLTIIGSAEPREVLREE